MKIIVLNSKGGVGKSTTAIQVLVPYLYSKNEQSQQIKVIEFDDENEDSKSFSLSKILDAKNIKVSTSDIDASLIDSILEDENIVLDIGGNKTTTYVLDSLIDNGMINSFDLIVIPLTDGEQDSINAIKVYDKIRENNKTSKIIFALNRVNTAYELEIQFLDFFGDTEKKRLDGRVGLIEKIKEPDRNIIKIVDSPVIRFSRIFGTTAYELSFKDMSKVREKIAEATVNKNTEEVRKQSYRLGILNKSKRYRNEVLEECFKAIDEACK